MATKKTTPRHQGKAGRAATTSSITETAGQAAQIELTNTVQVVPFLKIQPQVSLQAQEELCQLQKTTTLTRFLGGRRNGLLRPVPHDVWLYVMANCQAFKQLILAVEQAGRQRDLFVWGFRFDDARHSTTSRDDNPTSPNLHFDSGDTSFAQSQVPVFQAILNLGVQPRHFIYFPRTTQEMISTLVRQRGLSRRLLLHRPASELIQKYLEHFPVHLDIVEIPSGCCAVFNGRAVAHDAAKYDATALINGERIPASEPDFVANYDLLQSGRQNSSYDADVPFLSDRSRLDSAR